MIYKAPKSESTESDDHYVHSHTCAKLTFVP